MNTACHVQRARIVRSQRIRVSPWVELIEKDVQFAPGETAATYHSLGLNDYVTIVARTPSGLFPLVRQYRPAVEMETLEFPAGLVDLNESPETCCRRELMEETGLATRSLRSLGSSFPDTGRLGNKLYTFFVEASEPDPTFCHEPGIAVEFVNFETLRQYALSGTFAHQLHLGAVGMLLLASGATPDVKLFSASS